MKNDSINPNQKPQNLTENQGEKNKTKSPNILLSVVAGLFGIQNRQNQERDFTSGNISHFVIAGLLSVLFLLVTMIVVVNIVLS